MKLLLVDGSNIVMRCAYGGDIPPDSAVPAATGLIRRAAEQVGATHLVVALDTPGTPSWRKLEYSEYKANRERDTGPWIQGAGAAWLDLGWHIELAPGFEADDVIATIALRAAARFPVFVLSSDSDLLPLTQSGIVVARPNKDGADLVTSKEVCEKYDIPHPHLLFDLKAMVGEATDNIPGVPGIGAKKGAALIKKYGALDKIIFAGKLGDCELSAVVAKHEAVAKLSLRLVSLRPDVPVPAITPSQCRIQRARRAA